MKRQPKHAIPVNPEKSPKSRGIPQTPDGILWSFAVLDREGPFGWSKCNPLSTLLDVLFRKKSIETMRWNDLRQGGSHEINVSALCKEARDRLVEIKLDDLDSLYSLRISGANRVWCIRDRNVLRVLWWDPEHLVCPSPLKNT